jgi:hypothetical protein
VIIEVGVPLDIRSLPVDTGTDATLPTSAIVPVVVVPLRRSIVTLSPTATSSWSPASI